ncbi:ribosomal subunit interface protein [Halopseudomonas litoralis]|uniref:Ribosomal subunit interface protein n=1 Tax=Halopseudomonas litoralis TaxID=797277 RepID=A0A1H1TAN0_9GAMM|nr:HPF/RaiA family ribosome-associated protein [Halopseudomonas litoralis]SDS57141.1 ribosomal subunit interface protein [Halopseudomonas litoralis]
MQIQVHGDNHVEGSAQLAEWVSASISSKLERFDDVVTRVVVHIADENGDKAGPHDKRCQIEARPKGQQPVSVTHKAESVHLAVDGAIEKLNTSLTTLYGKLRAKRVSPQLAPEPVDPADQDALLEEDFLADEQSRSAGE